MDPRSFGQSTMVWKFFKAVTPFLLANCKVYCFDVCLCVQDGAALPWPNSSGYGLNVFHSYVHLAEEQPTCRWLWHFHNIEKKITFKGCAVKLSLVIPVRCKKVPMSATANSEKTDREEVDWESKTYALQQTHMVNNHRGCFDSTHILWGKLTATKIQCHPLNRKKNTRNMIHIIIIKWPTEFDTEKAPTSLKQVRRHHSHLHCGRIVSNYLLYVIFLFGRDPQVAGKWVHWRQPFLQGSLLELAWRNFFVYNSMHACLKAIDR